MYEITNNNNPKGDHLSASTLLLSIGPLPPFLPLSSSHSAKSSSAGPFKEAAMGDNWKKGVSEHEPFIYVNVTIAGLWRITTQKVQHKNPSPAEEKTKQ